MGKPNAAKVAAGELKAASLTLESFMELIGVSVRCFSQIVVRPSISGKPTFQFRCGAVANEIPMLDSLFGVISELNQMPVRIIQINGHTVAVISGVVTDASGISSFANAVLHLLSPRQSEVMEGRKIVRLLQFFSYQVCGYEV